MKSPWIIPLVVANLAGIVASNVCFRLSIAGGNLRAFLAWQLFGNLAGFGSVIAFTVLMRFVPLSIGYAVTAGLGFVLVQVVGARLLFREPIMPLQWLGSAVVVLGVALISFGGKT